MKVSVTEKEFKEFLEGADNETLRKHIYLRAVNKANHDDEVIYYPTEIDEIVLEVFLSTTIKKDDDEYYIGIKLTDDVLKVINKDMSIPELYFAALGNTKRDLPLISAQDLFEKKFGQEFPCPKDGPFKYLTTTEMRYGAAYAFYPGVLEGLAKDIGDDLYITFPSIHEMVVHPAGIMLNEGITKNDLYEILKETISETTMDEEILSRSVFYYDKRNDELVEVYKGE